MAELPKDMIFHYHSDDGITVKVDAIPLVRCRECRWGTMCVTGQHLGLDGFCSKGEREVQE